jgi:hypothetical protein
MSKTFTKSIRQIMFYAYREACFCKRPMSVVVHLFN